MKSLSEQFKSFLAVSNDVAELASSLNSIKINYFTFTRIKKNGGRIYLSNSPKTLEQYFRGEYYLVGNVEGDPAKYKEQVVMWDTLPNQYIYNEIPRANNFDHGIFMVDPHEDYCDFFGLATTKGNDQIINTYLSKMDYLKQFTREFTDRAEGMIETLDKNHVVLPFNQNVIDFAAGKKNETIKLSQRQIQIKDVFLQGKTIKEIAKTLGLSPRTVETHLNALKYKLNCKHRTDLIVKLLRLAG